MTTETTSDAQFQQLLLRVLERKSTRSASSPHCEHGVSDQARSDSDGLQRQDHDFTMDGLAASLSSRVLHQHDAVAAAARVISTRLGVARLYPERPHAVLLATGPTGTGKTTLGFAIAEHAYGSPEALVRIDCSELSSAASLSSLIGPPPGYVGFDHPSGWLTTRVDKLKQCVVLFDEIEKAHPDVWPILLQIAEGRLTDTNGKTVSFSQTTIMLTSNVGATEATRQPVGFGTTAPSAGDSMSTSVKRTFPPELLSRVDATLMFHQLPPGANLDIARQVWGRYQQRMKTLGWELDLDDTILEHVIGDLDISAKGVRELERTIEFEILSPLNGLQQGTYTAQHTSSGIQWARRFDAPSTGA